MKDILKDAYYAMLTTEHWKAFRQNFIERKNYTCELCGKSKADGAVLQLHHKCYRAGKRPWVYPDSDLQCLCIDCHRKVHIELHDQGKRIPVYDSDGTPAYIPSWLTCQHCGGSGFFDDFPYLLGGLCFYCFGTGMRYSHFYSPEEAKEYSFKIYNQWILHREKLQKEYDSPTFSGPEDVEKWLLSMNEHQ